MLAAGVAQPPTLLQCIVLAAGVASYAHFKDVGRQGFSAAWAVLQLLATGGASHAQARWQPLQSCSLCCIWQVPA